MGRSGLVHASFFYEIRGVDIVWGVEGGDEYEWIRRKSADLDK